MAGRGCKKVVYTCLVGNYDVLRDPQCVSPDWNYVCFSNSLQQDDFQVWQIKPLPNIDTKCQTRLARWPKLFPHLLFPDCDISLWHDAIISIECNAVYEVLENLIKGEAILSIPKHPLRNCIYDEAKAVSRRGLDYRSLIHKQVRMLKNSGFPLHYGLFETNIIYRRHHVASLKELSEEWWSIIVNYSRRDQLSLSYLLWKHGVTCAPMFADGFDVRRSVYFKYMQHRQLQTVSLLFRVKHMLDSLFNK